MTALDHPDRDDLDLVTILQALGDPVRLEIVRQIASSGERACGTFDLGISKATRSHHLRLLREAGITRTVPEGTRRIVSLRDEDLEARFPGLLASVLAGAPPLVSR